MNNITLSVIIPVYNTEPVLLEQCLLSCLNQTVPFDEIVVIDDGSTNRETLNTLRKYKSKLSIHSIANGGLSHARNTGVKFSTTSHFTFLDADDYLDKKTSEIIRGVEEDFDVILFKTTQCFKNSKKLFQYDIPNGPVDPVLLKEKILNFTSNISTAWAKVFKRSVIDDKNLYHDEKLRQGSEGIEFCYRVFSSIKTAYMLDARLYNYVYNDESISAGHSKDNDLFVIKCFEKILNLSSEPEHQLIYNRFSYVVISTLTTGLYLDQNMTKKEKKEYAKKYLEYDLVKKSIELTDKNKLDKARRVAIFACKHKMYFLLRLMGKIRSKQKHDK